MLYCKLTRKFTDSDSILTIEKPFVKQLLVCKGKSSHGYKFERVEDGYVLFRGGVKAATISLSEMEKHISQENDTRKERAKQLRAIIRKYKDEIAD